MSGECCCVPHFCTLSIAWEGKALPSDRSIIRPPLVRRIPHTAYRMTATASRGHCRFLVAKGGFSTAVQLRDVLIVRWQASTCCNRFVTVRRGWSRATARSSTGASFGGARAFVVRVVFQVAIFICLLFFFERKCCCFLHSRRLFPGGWKNDGHSCC